ncbi:pro-resilin-like [Uranotaenia lowii]|uniref:pro-resilin-like n=1 Tax=Uranotaenia lowii TaxID=190385 RepID=UPI002479E14C|nr:pro-resilin-like [Uranotaenia lowii]
MCINTVEMIVSNHKQINHPSEYKQPDQAQSSFLPKSYHHHHHLSAFSVEINVFLNHKLSVQFFFSSVRKSGYSTIIMKLFVAITVVSLAALALAEPPVPHSNYLPPNGNNGYNYHSNGNGGGNGFNGYPSAPSSQYGAPSGIGGSGSGYNYADANGGNGNSEPAKYSFQYDVQDFQSGNDFGHMESRDGDRTVGRYYVLLPDGRKQVVNYEADQNGYRPTITYEDTGAGANGAGGYPGSNQGGFQGY